MKKTAKKVARKTPSTRGKAKAAVSLDRVFYSLSDPVRLGIVAMLIERGECTCAELDGGRPKSTMSHHFKVLRDAGVVHTRVEGVTHINSLRRDEINAAYPGLLDVVAAAMG